MKNRFYLLISGFFTMLFISCYSPVNEDLSDITPKLVVNSLFTPDSVFTLYLARTRGFNDNLYSDTILWVDDAVCSLFVDNNFLEVLHNQGNGKYISSTGYHPLPGHFYSISIWHSDLGHVQASSRVPYPPQILEFEKQDTAGFVPDITDLDLPNESQSKMGIISLRIKTNDSHFLNIIARQTIAANWKYNCLGCSYDTLVISERVVWLLLPQLRDNLYQLGGTILMFSDDSVVNLTVFSDEYFLKDYLFKNLKIEIRAASDQYFLYYKSMLNQRRSTIMGNYEPVSYYSNIQGGYGIFAGYSSAVDSLTYPVSLDTAVLNNLNLYQK